MGSRLKRQAQLAILRTKHLVVAGGDVCRKRLLAQSLEDEVEIFKSEEFLRKL